MAFANIKQAIEFKKHFASWFSVTIDSIRKDKRKRKIENTIKALAKEEERTVLFLRYIKLLSWNQIMDVTGIRPLYKIFRVHGKALKHVIVD